MLNFPLFETDPGVGGSGAAGAPSELAPQPNLPNIADSFTGIPDKYSQDADFANFKSLDDVFGEFKQLKSLQSGREQNGLLEAIGENSTPEQIETFYKKLGKPESPVEYGFKAPEGLPQGLDYSDERAAKFAEIVHKHHLTKSQAEGLFNDLHNDILVPDFTSYQQMQEQQVADNFTKLEEVWGKEGTSTYAVNHKNAQRAFNAFATPEVAEAVKADPSMASNPLLLQLLSRAGAMMSPDSVPTVHGTTQTGSFGQNDLQGVEKSIKEFHSSGKFKDMLNPANANHKQLRESWNELNAKRRELMEKGGA